VSDVKIIQLDVIQKMAQKSVIKGSFDLLEQKNNVVID